MLPRPSAGFTNPSSSSNITSYLEILVQPQEYFKFRYESETKGAHGNLMGEAGKRTCPKVKLNHYNQTPNEKLIIRCSIYSDDGSVPHYHPLFKKVPKSKEFPGGRDIGPVEIPISGPDFTAEFQNMSFCFLKKIDRTKSSAKKGKKNMRSISTDSGASFSSHTPEPVDTSSAIDNDMVCLKFEALVDNGRENFTLICPPAFSNIVKNNNSPRTNELKIHRVSRCNGSCKGGDEVWILVNKVDQKNINIKFYRKNEDNSVWSEKAKIIKVHNQTAIVFLTPRYQHLDITENKTVKFHLEREHVKAVSQDMEFEYLCTPNASQVESSSVRDETGSSCRKRTRQNDDFSTTQKRTELKTLSQTLPSILSNQSPQTTFTTQQMVYQPHPSTFTSQVTSTNEYAQRENQISNLGITSHSPPQVANQLSKLGNFQSQIRQQPKQDHQLPQILNPINVQSPLNQKTHLQSNHFNQTIQMEIPQLHLEYRPLQMPLFGGSFYQTSNLSTQHFSCFPQTTNWPSQVISQQAQTSNFLTEITNQPPQMENLQSQSYQPAIHQVPKTPYTHNLSNIYTTPQEFPTSQEYQNNCVQMNNSLQETYKIIQESDLQNHPKVQRNSPFKNPALADIFTTDSDISFFESGVEIQQDVETSSAVEHLEVQQPPQVDDNSEVAFTSSEYREVATDLQYGGHWSSILLPITLDSMLDMEYTTDGIKSSSKKTSHSPSKNESDIKDTHKKSQDCNANQPEEQTEYDLVASIEEKLNSLAKLWQEKNITEKDVQCYLLRLFSHRVNDENDSVLHILAGNEGTLPVYSKIVKFVEVLKRFEVVKEVLKLKNKYLETPLLTAAARGTPEMVELLLDAGADVNATDLATRSALNFACLRGNLGEEIMVALLKKEPSLTVYNEDGLNILQLAVSYQRLDLIDLLMDETKTLFSFEDIINLTDRRQGNTALHIAVELRNVEIVKCLLREKKTNVNAKNFDGKTPLALILDETDENAVKIVEILLLNKADISLVEYDSYEEEDVDSEEDSKTAGFDFNLEDQEQAKISLVEYDSFEYEDDANSGECNKTDELDFTPENQNEKCESEKDITHELQKQLSTMSLELQCNSQARVSLSSN